MALRIPDKEKQQKHEHGCACGCSNAYDQIDDRQFEKAFELKLLSTKQVAIAAFIVLALIAAICFFIYR